MLDLANAEGQRLEGSQPERTAAPAVAGLGLLPTLESGIGRAAALAGTVAGTVGLLYVIGGCVMWLRFYMVGLPADQAVALMPKTDLLVIGLRVMVLPALAVGALLLFLVSRWVRRRTRIERLQTRKREQELRLATHFERQTEADRTQTEIHDEVQALADALDQERAPVSIKDALPDRRHHPVRFWLLVLAAVAAALVVPFSPGALAWPLGTAAVVGSWLHLRAESLRTPTRPVPVWRVAGVAVLAAAVISIARQSDPPVQLPVVQVTVADPAKIPPNVLVDSRSSSPPPSPATTVTGVLVAMTAKEIDVGDPVTHSIASIPRAAASSIAVGPSVDRSSPPQSLASRFVGGRTAWALTPLEFWCGNERYGWTRILKLCTGRPYVDPRDTSATSVPDGLVGLRVTCPADAPEVCRGYLRVTTEAPYPDAAGRLTTPLTMPPAFFSVAQGNTGDVKVSVDQATLWDQVDTGDHSGPAGLAVRLRLSADTAGKAVVHEGRGWITVPHPAAPALPAPKPGKTPTGTATPTPTASAAPAEPTATPDGSSPLQSEGQSRQVPAATPTPEP